MTSTAPVQRVFSHVPEARAAGMTSQQLELSVGGAGGRDVTGTCLGSCGCDIPSIHDCEPLMTSSDDKQGDISDKELQLTTTLYYNTTKCSSLIVLTLLLIVYHK